MSANRNPGHLSEAKRDAATPRRANPRVAITRPSILPSQADLLTARDLEELLKIDVKTIYTYVQRGLIPYVRIQSNVRFVRQQIFDWIGEHNYHPRPTNGNGARRQ